MNYDEILRKQDFYEHQIFNKVAMLERAKINNKERDNVLSRSKSIEALFDSLTKYSQNVKVLLAAVDNEDRAFKNRRIAYLDTLVTDSLAAIFPADGLEATLSCDFYRKSEAVITLKDRFGNELDPDICSGKLQQYLISFAAVSGIVSGLGIQSLFVDEAFGAAAPEILGEIGELLKKQIDKGMQIILIAQNPGLYQDLPRHEVKIRKNEFDSVYVLAEDDY